LLSILLCLAVSPLEVIPEAMAGHLSHSGALEAKVTANAGDTASGVSAATISDLVCWFVARVDQSSKGPAAVDADSFDDRAGPIHPREEGIESFHFL
jgi:hypothetical protein